MKLYKILKKQGETYYSPFQSYRYGILDDFIGVEMVCEYFDDSNEECSNGFYATDLNGLIYTNLSQGKTVFEVEMSGRNIKFSDYKWRWEKQTFIREIPIEELKELVKVESDKMDWNYYEMLFPKNLFNLPIQPVTDKHKKLLKEWDSVRNSVRGSVWDSVWDSVRDSVWDSVLDSVRNSVLDSVRGSVRGSVRVSFRDSFSDSISDHIYAYISSAFPKINKWKYINHEDSINPFQSGIDLWNDGVIAGFDGKTWKLYSGTNAEIVFEIYKEDLMNL